MGTSKDYSGSTGGGWTRFKRAATRLASEGGGDRAVGSVVERYVSAVGGPAAAAASAVAGARVAMGVGRLLSGVGAAGFTPTLEELGLGEFVGHTPIELIAALSDAVGGDGATLEEAAARDALIFLLEELFRDAETFDDLEQMILDQARIWDLFAVFIARYVYLRLLPLLDERLIQRGDPALAPAIEQEVYEYTLASARLNLTDVDVAGLDWTGTEAETIAADLLLGVYTVFGE